MNCTIVAHTYVRMYVCRALLYFGRFSTITCKQCIVGLLNRAGKAYKICKNQNSFVTDLLKLNVPKLLFVPEDVSYQVEKAFSDMIQSFIQENGLQQIITEQAVVIVVRL